MNKKKQTSSSLYPIYYSLLGGFILLQVIYTLYQTSLVVAHGRTQRSLESTQQQLTKEKQLLRTKLAQKTSLQTFLKTESLAEYQLISKPIVISKSTSLAAAN